MHAARIRVQYGWRCWLRALAVLEANGRQADKHRLQALQQWGLESFSEYVMHQRILRTLACESIVAWVSYAQSQLGVRLVVHSWRKGWSTWATAMGRVEQQRTRAAMRVAVRTWYLAVVCARAAIAAHTLRMQAIVGQYCDLWCSRDVFKFWICWVVDTRAEREQAQRRTDMRSKVDGWLGEFRKEKKVKLRPLSIATADTEMALSPSKSLVGPPLSPAQRIKADRNRILDNPRSPHSCPSLLSPFPELSPFPDYPESPC